MTFSTGEFQIPKLQTTGLRLGMSKRTACVFNDQLHTITTIDGGELYLRHNYIDLNSKKMLKRDTTKLHGTDKIDPDYFKDNANWSQVSDVIWQHILPENGYVQGQALTANSKNLFLFFSALYGADPYTELQAKIYHPASPEDGITQEGWGEDITLHTHSYTLPIYVKEGGISAKFFGENQIIIALPGLELGAEDGNYASNQYLRLYIFDIRDLDLKKSSKWVARSLRWVPLTVKNNYHSDNIDLKSLKLDDAAYGKNVDIDWFVVVPTDGKTKEPEYHLGVNFTPGGLSLDNVPRDFSFSTTFRLALKPDGSGELADGHTHQFINENPQFYLRGDGHETGLMRDPAGRLRRFCGPMKSSATVLDGNIGAIYTNTNVLPTIENKFGTDGQYDNIFPKPLYKTSDDYTGAAGAFHLFTQGSAKSDVAEGKATDTPVLEFIIYGDGKCQIREYGKIRTVSFSKELKRKPKAPEYIIGGYFDGPIPFPKQNFIDQLQPNAHHDVGNFLYKIENSTDTQSTDKQNWTVGFESEGKTTKGVGVAWNVSAEGGMGSIKKERIETRTGGTLPVVASVKTDANGELKAEGSGLAGFLNATYHFLSYQFFDANGHVINDGLTKNPAVSAKLSSHLISMHSAKRNGESFEPYLVEPGNLESYTAEAINKKMSGLGYKGDDYFKDMILKHALPIGNGKTPMSFTWTYGNPASEEFHDSKEDFTEQNWTLDAKAYFGVSSGEEASLFGFGENAEMEFLAGGKYSTEQSKEKGKTTEISLEIGTENWGPFRSDRDDAVHSYSFSAYYLPVPKDGSGLDKNHWTMELVDHLTATENKFLPSMVDQNSGCWRIVFIVTNIQYNQPNGTTRINYPPDEVE